MNSQWIAPLAYILKLRYGEKDVTIVPINLILGYLLLYGN